MKQLWGFSEGESTESVMKDTRHTEIARQEKDFIYTEKLAALFYLLSR